MEDIEKTVDTCLDPEIKKDLEEHLAPIARLLREGRFVKMKKAGGTNAIFVNPNGVIPADLVIWDEKTA